MDTALQILLIDDNPVWAETLAEFLRRRGYRTETVQDPRAGLALLESRPVDLAIIDVHMPELDGLELLSRIPKNGNGPTVLVLSGDDDPALAHRAVRAGARAFLPKSTAPNLLL